MSAIKEYYHEEITIGQVTANEKAAHDWGRKDYQTQLLEALEEQKYGDTPERAFIWDYAIEFVKTVKP